MQPSRFTNFVPPSNAPAHSSRNESVEGQPPQRRRFSDTRPAPLPDYVNTGRYPGHTTYTSSSPNRAADGRYGAYENPTPERRRSFDTRPAPLADHGNTSRHSGYPTSIHSILNSAPDGHHGTYEYPPPPPQPRQDSVMQSPYGSHIPQEPRNPGFSATGTSSTSTQRPQRLIVGLFALRLAEQLIRTLDPYENRDADLIWIAEFLRPYPQQFALAKLKDASVIDNYADVYPRVIRRFTSKPDYPTKFMAMNPDRKVTDRYLTDEEALAIVDFADAAREWGSIVRLPGHEKEHIESLASKRQIAH